MAKQLKVAIIQDSPVFLNLQATVEKAVTLIRQAAEAGAKIIASPETWLPGYPVWLDEAPNTALWDHAGAKALYRLLVENSVTMGDQALAIFQSLSDELDVYLVLGANERDGKTLYNTIFYFSPHGTQPQRHRKLTPTYTEKLLWGVGDGSMLEGVDTPWGRLGALICWEHWMPLQRAHMHAQAEVVHVAQWPAVNEQHLLASRHYAFEGRTFVLASGMVLTKGQAVADVRYAYPEEHAAIALLESMAGDDHSWLKDGGSAIIGPDSYFITEPQYEKAALIIAEIDLNQVVEGQMALDVSGHYSRPDIFKLEVAETCQKK